MIAADIYWNVHNTSQYQFVNNSIFLAENYVSCSLAQQMEI